MEARTSPRVSVAAPVPAWRRVVWVGIYLFVVLFVAGIIGALTENPALLEGTLMAVVVGAAIVVIEVSLILRMRSRKRRSLLASARYGTILATPAQPIRTAVNRPMGMRQCLLLLDANGFSQVRAKDPSAAPAVTVPWRHLAEISTRPIRLKPLASKLRIVTFTGDEFAWVVQGPTSLATALNEVSSRWTSRSVST